MRVLAAFMVLAAGLCGEPEPLTVTFGSLEVRMWGPDERLGGRDPWIASESTTATVRLWDDAAATKPYAAGSAGFSPVRTIALSRGQRAFSTGTFEVPLID